MGEEEPQFLIAGSGEAARRIAFRAGPSPDGRPGLFWLPGFKSDMASTKASALAAWAAEHGFGMTRFDYSGHGLSEGRFQDGTIGRWLEDAAAVFAEVAKGPQILVGSSMGGYVALLLVRKLAPGRAQRIRALVLIAPAWDMTELIWEQLSPVQRAELEQDGMVPLPSAYGDPLPVTRALIEEGRNHLLEGQRFEPGCPVRIVHGRLDAEVPFSRSQALTTFLTGDSTVLIEVADGDHRLSRPEDLNRLYSVVADLARER